jgi:hypothetical protein
MLKRPLLALLALSLVLCSSKSEATTYECEDFLYPHIHFRYCSPDCRRSDMAMLYYSGLMEALNAHIDRRVKEGALQAKKLEIEFSDPSADMPAPVVEVSQSRKGYYVASRDAEDLNLLYLTRVVDYFASKNWKPFSCCDSHIKVTPKGIRRRFGRILDREVGHPDLSFFDGRRSIVFELGDLEVVYESDRLFFLLAGTAFQDRIPFSQGIGLRPQPWASGVSRSVGPVGRISDRRLV